MVQLSNHGVLTIKNADFDQWDMAMGLGGNPPQKRWDGLVGPYLRCVLYSISIFAGQEPTNSFFQRLHPFSSPFFLLLPGPEVHHCGVTGRFRDPLTSQHGQDMAWRETPRQLRSEQETSKRPRSIYFGVVPRTNNIYIYIYIFIYLYIYLSMNILY